MKPFSLTHSLKPFSLIHSFRHTFFYVFLLTFSLFLLLSSLSAQGIEREREVSLYDWENIEEVARGQTVYFYAWGGGEPINAYIAWAGRQLKSRYGVTLNHVKITDISQTVNKILAEKKAGKRSGGSVDLVWINGENFRTMKSNELLFGPFTNVLPYNDMLAREQNITMDMDFSEPVEGLEAPWGLAKLVFIADSARVKDIPENVLDLLTFVQANPGQFTYPRPPEFHGTTFLKQILLELLENSEALYKPLATREQFLRVSAPLWGYLDQLHPYLWRKGKAFAQSIDFQHQLLDEGEISISLSFNPNTAQNRVLNDEFPPTVRTYVHSKGTIGNTHFLGIPFNANAKDGALVAINFFQSPEAQARKANPEIWGDPTVLDTKELSKEDREYFSAIKRSDTLLDPSRLGRTILEPHASWTEAIEEEWKNRYAQ